MLNKINVINFISNIENYLDKNSLIQGIIGIQLPPMVSSGDLSLVWTKIFDLSSLLNYDVQFVMIPPPLTGVFLADNNKHIESIGRRVRRDRLDGIRYNRVYIALYWDDLGSLNSAHHDIFFQWDDVPPCGRISISDNRESKGDVMIQSLPISGDKFVASDKMKEVINSVTSKDDNGNSPDVLFSIKSLLKRTTGDNWIETPEDLDPRRLAENLLPIIKENRNTLNQMQVVIKRNLLDGSLYQGTYLTFDIPPLGAKVGVSKTISGNNIIKIQMGGIGFFFVQDKTLVFDWTQLMIDQLEGVIA